MSTPKQKKGGLKRKFGKGKIGRVIGNFIVGALNATPLAIFTPSVQDYNEYLDDADLDGDGKIGNVARGGMVVYYLVRYAPAILGMIAGLSVVVFGILKGLPKEDIEWAVRLILDILG